VGYWCRGRTLVGVEWGGGVDGLRDRLLRRFAGFRDMWYRRIVGVVWMEEGKCFKGREEVGSGKWEGSIPDQEPQRSFTLGGIC
jgi:hypothetical protein